MTPEQIANVASGAGFRGDGLVKAIAVALAESGGNERATNTNTDTYRSVDRGLWQINSHWHPEVSAAQAFNPATAARHALRISKGGTDWSQWSTWPVAAGVQLGRARLAAAPYLNVKSYTYTPGGVTVTDAGAPGSPRPGASPTTAQPAGWKDWLADKYVGPDGLNLAPGGGAEIPWGTVTGATDMLGAARQAIALAGKAAAWISDAHNWTRIAFVVGGGAAILVGAQQLAASGSLGSTAAGVGAIPGKAAGLVPVAKIAKAVK